LPVRIETAGARNNGRRLLPDANLRDRVQHIAEWWIALRAHDLLTGRNPSLRPAGPDGSHSGTFRLAQLAATAGYAD
jgi:hypothetical protein